MSKRENIASDIINKLDAVTSPIEFKKLTREPFDVEELSDAQFPAIFIQSGDETREVSSIGVTGSGTYTGTIDFLIVAFGKGTTSNIDTVRNQLIEVIEETLDADVSQSRSCTPSSKFIQYSCSYSYSTIRVNSSLIS